MKGHEAEGSRCVHRQRTAFKASIRAFLAISFSKFTSTEDSLACGVVWSSGSEDTEAAIHGG